MLGRLDRLGTLAIGDDRTTTRRAVLLAVGFLVAGATLEYLVLRTGFENDALAALHQALLLDGYLPAPHATGAFLVVGLAALQALVNRGYLPSVLLGWSLAFGNVCWTVGSRVGVRNYYLDPAAAFRRTFPEAVVLASLGFLLGLGIGNLRARRRGRSTSGSDSTA